MAEPWPVPTSSADAGPDQLVDFNTQVYFDGSGSTGVGALEYTWFFRDGTVTTSDSPFLAHTYEMEGVYEVGLLVEDANGYFDFDTVQITVKNYFPVAGEDSYQVFSEDELISFDGSSAYDLNNDIISYDWDFDDGSTASGMTTSKSYANAGEYHATLTVTDNDGAYDVQTRTMMIENVDPTADGIANGELDDELTVYEDDLINFDASESTDTPSDEPNLIYFWTFGDGSRGSGITASHTYTKQGVYHAALMAIDDNDGFTMDSIKITVLNAVPDANSGPDQSVYEGAAVFFNAQASSDTPTDAPLMDFSWNLPDQGANPTYSWYDDSINDVELLLTDDNDDSGSDVTTISVLNSAPEASVHTAYIPVDFTLRTAGKKGYDVKLEILEGSMVTDQLEVMKVPGNPDDQSSETQVDINIVESAMVKVYFTPMDDDVKGQSKGATPVWLELSFEDGTTTTLFRNFNVNKQQDWVWDIDLGEHLVGQTVHFQGAVYEPGTDDVTVLWDFGDGTTVTNYYPYSGSHPVVIQDSAEHTFTKFGEFEMTFSAEDDDSGIGTDTLIVHSQKDGISVDNVAPEASAASDKISVMEDELLEFSALGSDTSSDMGILACSWDFGDGNSASTDEPSHSYETDGVYTVLLKISDDSADYGVDHLEILVSNSEPAAVLSADSTAIYEDGIVTFDASGSTDTLRDLPKLSYAWDFGDGSKGSGIITEHQYTNRGVYTVVLTVQDDNGALSTDSVQITVSNAAPYNVNIIAETEVVQDEQVFFTRTSADTPSDEPLLIHSWNFGDGALAHGRSTTHSYSVPGLYTVQLKVFDDDFSFSIATAQINVANVEPAAYAGAESLKLYGPEITLEFEGRGFDTFTDQEPLIYKWNLGGGVFQYTPNVFITFSATGVYVISFQVTDLYPANSNVVQITIDFTLDTDGDMVTDETEILLGTDPELCDSDSDNLLDYMEVYDYPTDPLVDDTDSDSLNDWHEITHFGLSDPDDDLLVNPLDWDSDGEWIPDGDDLNPMQYNDVDGSELFWDAITVRNDIGSGVSVVMYGGTCFSKPTISEVSSPAPVAGDIGIFVEIESSCTPPFNSQIRVRYAESALPAGTLESNLALYVWSSTDNIWKIAGETGVDTTYDFVWARVTDFSIFAVMDASQLDSDGDGLKDQYEQTTEYNRVFAGYSYTAYTEGTPLYVKNAWKQILIPAGDITSYPGLTQGTIDLLGLGFSSGDFSTNNIWMLTNGIVTVYLSLNSQEIWGVQSAELTFYINSAGGFNFMYIETTSRTDPFDSDTDGDALTDGAEVDHFLTDPLDSDTDNDGLNDGEELNKYYTDPNDSDTDDDGVSDGSDYDPLVDLQLTVIIKEILQHDWVDPLWPWQNGDFFVKVCINGWWWTQTSPGYLHEAAHEYPNLDIARDIPDNSQYVDVKIQLWDDDLEIPFVSGDHLMDISRTGYTVDLTYDVTTGLWSGDDSVGDRNGLGLVSGNEDGSYSWNEYDCSLWFDIQQNDYDGDKMVYWREINTEYQTYFENRTPDDADSFLVESPLFIKNNRIEYQIPSEDIEDAGYEYTGNIDLFSLGFEESDFAADNTWQITDGSTAVYATLHTPKVKSVDSVSLDFELMKDGWKHDTRININSGYTDPRVKDTDSDWDGMPDWWEVRYGFDRINPLDAQSDPDHDHLSNLGEYQWDTAPDFFEINLMVSLNWDASPGYISQVVSGIKSASDFLYDVTDGHLYFRTVVINDNKTDWDEADVQIKKGTSQWPKARIEGYMIYPDAENSHIFMPETFFLFDPSWPMWYKTLVHECGHYIMNLYDEDHDVNGNTYLVPPFAPTTVMNIPQLYSEMSTPTSYSLWWIPWGYADTVHRASTGGESGWETFFNFYKDYIYFDLNLDGDHDDTFHSSYVAFSGPATMVHGAYTLLDVNQSP